MPVTFRFFQGRVRVVVKGRKDRARSTRDSGRAPVQQVRVAEEGMPDARETRKREARG